MTVKLNIFLKNLLENSIVVTFIKWSF